MRLFIAADLPDAVLDALAETSAMLRGSVRGRFVAPDSFHVTLAFLGEVPGSRVPVLQEVLDEVAGSCAPFDIALGELGMFGKRGKAALWQGFRQAGELRELAQAVRVGLRAQGFAIDEKEFLPHVTLMRAADLTAGVLPSKRSGIAARQLD